MSTNVSISSELSNQSARIIAPHIAKAMTVFNYNDQPVTFKKNDDGSIMVNATEMAKPFRKRPSDWLSNQSTKEFLDELTVTRKSVTADYQPVVKIQGGDPSMQGTWLHEDAALEFARWLAPAFSIWCNDHIKELLTTGKTAVVPMTMEEMLLEQCKMMVEHSRALREQERRLNDIENWKQNLENERKENTEKLLSVDVSDAEEVPAMSDRAKINKMVNMYSTSHNVSQKDVWHSVYDNLAYKYGRRIHAYNRGKNESLLEVAERNNLLKPIYDIVSDMIKS